MKHSFVVTLEFAELVTAKETQTAIRKALKGAEVAVSPFAGDNIENVPPPPATVKPTGVKIISIGEQ